MVKKLYIFLIEYKIIRDIFIFIYKLRGEIPWSLGYNEYKWKNIENVLKTQEIIKHFRNKQLPKNFGIGLDERIIEYPWVFANINKNEGDFLDAGSAFNYLKILKHDLIKNKNLTIYTYYPEAVNFNNRRVSYVYGDLRSLPFRDENFEEIICQSTIEHIDMDNSIYGYKINNSSESKNKSYEYLKALSELCRVLKKNGALLITFPFGKFENHGFFQQFDLEMLQKIKDFLKESGNMEINFIKYLKDGWNFCGEKDCKDVVSFNPHTNNGRENDGAAHCRAVCCVKFIKK